MRRNHIPSHVQSKLDKLERQIAVVTQQVSKNKEAITAARGRLSGGFENDGEYADLRAALDKLVADKPILERKLDDAQYSLADAKAFLAGLPDDATLEPIAPVKPNGADLASVRRHIANAEDEIARLAAVPTPSSDIEERIEGYVDALARPKVTGMGAGQQLRVDWPHDVIAVLALLLPEQMVKALSHEIERMANVPMSLTERNKRIGELKSEIDTLQRQALALGADTSGLPPGVVLGVRAVEAKKSRAA